MEKYQYNKKSVLSLLKTNPDKINQPNKDGQTVLHFAADKGHIDIVKLLLEQMTPAGINQVDIHGWTALYDAANGHADIVKLLLDRMSPAAINQVDKNGWTALHDASSSGTTKAVELLLQKMDQDSINKANNDGKTALHLSALHGYTDIVELLLQEMDKDAVSLRDSLGKTAFEYTKPHKEIFAVIQKIPQEIINQIDKDVHRTTEKHQEDNTDAESVSCLGKLSLEN
jgi:ankyrin repeat protein